MTPFPIREIYYSSHFRNAFSKLPHSVKKQAIGAEQLFRSDCFNPRLKTHKLKGKLEGFWSFSINYSYRIMFEFRGKGKVDFIDAGDHSIYG